MSRDQQDAGRSEDPPGPPDSGRLSTTGPGAVVGAALVGLVLGWAVRPVWLELGATAPRVGWLQAAVLWVAGAFLLQVAWVTARVVRGEGRPGTEMLPHQAVNRLVLAKAGALAGALVGGGYLGYALTWVGVGREVLGPRVWLSLLAAAGAGVVVIGSLLLERACRTPRDAPET